MIHGSIQVQAWYLVADRYAEGHGIQLLLLGDAYATDLSMSLFIIFTNHNIP